MIKASDQILSVDSERVELEGATSLADIHLEEFKRLTELEAVLMHSTGLDDDRNRFEFPLDCSLATDRKLQSFVSEIRTEYLQAVSKTTSSRWRTPPDGVAMPFPETTQTYSYTYDRQHPPKILEDRLRRSNELETILFSSGMAALNTVLQSLNFLIDDRLKLVGYFSYFETLSLLRIGPFSRRLIRAKTEAQLIDAIVGNNVGIIFIEPVHYDWSLKATHWPDILASLAALSDPPILILDTTLTPECEALDQLLKDLRRTVEIVICARSGTKMDQQGLELTNLGVVDVWCANVPLRRKIVDTVRTSRSICGSSLTWPDACSLAPSIVFSNESTRDYSRQIFNSAAQLREHLMPYGRLIKSVSYPDPPWPSPLVIVELNEGGSENYRTLSELIDQIQIKRGIGLNMSGSFGFRTLRYETILPEELHRPGETHSGALKIAAGSYPGALQNEFCNLLIEISSFPDLRTAGAKLLSSSHSQALSSIGKS